MLTLLKKGKKELIVDDGSCIKISLAKLVIIFIASVNLAIDFVPHLPLSDK